MKKKGGNRTDNAIKKKKKKKGRKDSIVEKEKYRIKGINEAKKRKKELMRGSAVSFFLALAHLGASPTRQTLHVEQTSPSCAHPSPA